jgi:hypothetical protein
VPVDPLAGSLRHVLSIIALVALAREGGLDTAYVPANVAREATLLAGGATPGSGMLEDSN